MGIFVQGPVQAVLRDVLQKVQAKGRNELTLVVLGAPTSPPSLLANLVTPSILLALPFLGSGSGHGVLRDAVNSDVGLPEACQGFRGRREMVKRCRKWGR